MGEHEKGGKKTGNKASDRCILITVYMFLAFFTGLIAYMVYFNAVKAKDVINSPYNKRQAILERKVTRGPILSADGNVIAVTVTNPDGGEVRYYPYNGLFAHAVGFIEKGGSGIESTCCYYMLNSSQNPFEQILNDIKGDKNKGDSLIITLDSGLQQAAYEALGGNRGAVIVSEPSTGRILAMVSKPDFNPNLIGENWDIITAKDADSVLVNRASQGLYPPGSTFKLVTALAYLRENASHYTDYSYTCNGVYRLEQTGISCAMGKVHGDENLRESIVNSCNTSFVNIGLGLDVAKYRDTAQGMLFNSKLPFGMEYNESRFVLNGESSEWDIAQTAFGQGQTVITPLHLSMIGNSIACGGMLMKPYMTDRVESADGAVIKKFAPREYGRIMTEEEAEFLSEAMTGAAEVSFDWLFGGAGYSLACKSGTAQYGKQGYEHSLFVSFSPLENPEIAVTVVVEGGKQRTLSAAEVAKTVYDYWYGKR